MSKELKKGIPKAIVTGEIHFTEEEKAKNDVDFEKILKEHGILAKNETIKDLKK